VRVAGVSRRVIVSGILLSAAAGVSMAEAETDPYERVRSNADALAAALAALHGGRWNIHINHVAKTAVIIAEV